MLVEIFALKTFKYIFVFVKITRGLVNINLLISVVFSMKTCLIDLRH